MKALQEVVQGFKAGVQSAGLAEQERQARWESQPLWVKLVELVLVVLAVVAYWALFGKG